MTKLWHPLLKLNFWFSGRVMWPRVEHCRFERFRVERPAFSGRNNGSAFQLRVVHSRNCSIKLCTIYGISVSKLIMEWFFIKLLIKWTYSHACTCCDSEEINESSFESMRATSGRSATRSVRPEGVQGVKLLCNTTGALSNRSIGLVVTCKYCTILNTAPSADKTDSGLPWQLTLRNL